MVVIQKYSHSSHTQRKESDPSSVNTQDGSVGDKGEETHSHRTQRKPLGGVGVRGRDTNPNSTEMRLRS